MLLVDGSRHDWLEGRGPHLTLLGFTDDTTGKCQQRWKSWGSKRLWLVRRKPKDATSAPDAPSRIV